MSCKDCQTQLNEALHPEQELAPQLEAHLAGCPACQALRLELIDLKQDLQQLPPPALPQGFQLDLRRRLVEQEISRAGEPTRTEARSARRWVIPSLVAAAAALALVVVGGLLDGERPTPATTSTFQQLSLSIRAAQEHPDARFSIQLPPGVELAPEAGSELKQGRSLRWSSRLRAGINEIDLPLVVVGQTPGRVQASLTIDGKTYLSQVDLGPRVPAGAGASLGSGQPRLAWNLERHQPDREVIQ